MTDERGRLAEIAALERAGRLAQAAALARELAEATADPAERPLRRVHAAELALEVDGPTAARPLLEQALAEARRGAARAAAGLAQAELARLDLFGRDAESLSRAERLLDSAERTLGARPAVPGVACRIAHYRGLLASRRGEPATSVEHLRRAYELADGDPGQRSRILNSWGLQLEAWGDPDEARRLLERSLELKLQLEDHYGAAATYGSLAFLHTRLGAYAEARDALARDLELTERIGARDLLPGLHARLAGALVGLGRIGGAEREAQQALDLARGSTSVPMARAVGFAWRELARVRCAQGRLDEAEQAVRERALAAFEQLRDPYGAALARLTLAEVAIARAAAGEPAALDRARQALDAARPVFARLGAVQETAEGLLLQARVLLARGEPDRAARVLHDRVLPLVERMARATPHLRRAALDLLAQAAPRARDERLEVLAGQRRVETLLAEHAGEAATWTVVAVAVSSPAEATRLARAATSEGGIVTWRPPDRAVVLLGGEDAPTRGAALRRRLRGAAAAVVEGEATVDTPWPGPPLARGPAVDQALAAVAPRAPRTRTKRAGGTRK